MRLVRIWMMFAALSLGMLAGCKADPMGRARAAHATERADEAEAALKEVLAENPKDFEARRLMADLHRFRGEFAKTEEALEALWKEKGFDEDKEFPDGERAQRDLLENQFNELYSKWCDALDSTKDPDKFEKVVRSGLKWKKKSPTLNNLLVDHFLAKAEALEKEGKKLEAAQTYEEVLQLQIMRAQRKDAQTKASALRRAAFADGAMAKFEAIKAELVAAEQWDDATKTVSFKVETEVGKRLKQKNDADLEKARTASTATIRTTIAQWVAKLSGVSAEVAAVTAPKMGSGDEKLGRGKYSVTISMVLDDVINAAFDAQQKAEAAAKQAPEKVDEPAKEPAPEAGSTNAGSGTTGTTGKE